MPLITLKSIADEHRPVLRAACICLLALMGYLMPVRGEYNVLRIEHEIKLTVPKGTDEILWRYLVENIAGIASIPAAGGTAHQTEISNEIFVDEYFDDKDFTLLNNQSCVRYRTRYLSSDSVPGTPESKLVQIKINNIGEGPLSRGEFKYPVEHYRLNTEKLDNHPLLKLIERSHRREFIDRLKKYHVKAEELIPRMNITQHRKRIYLNRNGTPLITVTLDNSTATNGNNEIRFTELEIELNEMSYTSADEAARAEMEKMRNLIHAAIRNHFPELKQDQTPKYNKAARLLGVHADKKGMHLLIIIFAAAGLFSAGTFFFMRYRARR